MADLTATEIREHIETDLGDDALNRFLADAYGAIKKRVGVEGEQTVVIYTRGSDRYLMLPRPINVAADIDSIIERLGATEVTLETTDWRWLGGRTLERLSGSSEPTLWGWNFSVDEDVPFQTVVTYTPRV